MNNKKNKNSSYVKKIILAFVIILAIMFVYNVILEYKDSKNAYKITENDKTLLIKYTLVDKEAMGSDTTVDQLWLNSHFDALYNIVVDNVKLEKENDYYVADLNYVNDSIKEEITDVIFAKNNDHGEVIDDCKFDKEKLKIYIPTKYYKDSNRPVQTQILSKIDSDKIAINYKKGNEKRKIVADVYDNALKIPIVNSEAKGNKLKSSDINLYINGKKYYLDKSNSNYLKNGSLDIDMNASLVNNIEVKISKKGPIRKIVEKIFAATIVKANTVTVDFSSYKSVGTIPTSEASQVAVDNVYYFYYPTNEKVRAIIGTDTGMTSMATRCNYLYNNDIHNCLMYPFDYYNGNTTNHTAADNAVSSGNSSSYCSSVFSGDSTRQTWCNDYFARVKQCKQDNSSYSNDKCKALAYFTAHNNYTESNQLFNGFMNSYDRLIFKQAQPVQFSETCPGSGSDPVHACADRYGYEVLFYIYFNDNTSTDWRSLHNEVIGKEHEWVFQFLHLPNSRATTDLYGWEGNPYNQYSSSSTFPLNLRTAMNKNGNGTTDGYALAICGHIDYGVPYDDPSNVLTPYHQIIGDKAPQALGVKIVKKTNDYLVLAASSYPTGMGAEDQAAFGIYKFDIGNEKKGRLQIEKEYQSPSEEAAENPGVIFDIYEGTESGGQVNCGSTKIASSSTTSSTTKVINNLEVDKSYCIWERGSEHDFDVTYKVGNTNVTRNATFTGSTGTYKVGFVTISSSTITPTTSGDVDTYTLTVNAKNIRKKYCYGVKKVDQENTSLALKSTGDEPNKKFTFTSNGQTVSTTTSSNIAVFGPFKYASSYTVKETNVAEGVTADQGIYWTNAPDVTVSASSFVEATYNSNNGNYSCPSITYAQAIAMPNVKHYYCARIQKVDASSGNVPLAGAKFTSPGLTGYNESGTANGETETSGNKQGYYYFFTGNNPASIAITESQVPSGYYANSLTVNVTPVLMANTIRANSSIADQIAACNTAYTGQTSTQVNNYRYLLNWFKVDENETKSNGAKFIVQDSDGKYLKLGAVQEQADKDGHDKKCYPLTGTTTNINEATVVVSQDVGVHSTAKDGEACIMGLNPGNYKVIETDSIESHTFGSFKELTIASSESYQSKTNANTFINYPTRVELDKKSTSTDDYTNSELTKIIFNLYRVDQNGNPVGEPITLDDLGNGLYDYISQTSQTTSLHVNGDAKLVITHLPKDNYIIMENQTDSCDDSTDPTKCIGYYMPTGSENGERFTITKCSSDEATSCGIGEYGKEIVTVWNTPTQIDFTELDYYRIYDQSDIAIEGNTVDGIYSTQMDRSDFDRMVFTLYDKDNNPVSLQFVGNHGDCTSDDDYAEYRYVIGGEATGVTDLHTCGGHLRVTHLCRGATYTIKEQSVAENSVFVLEDTPSTPTQKDYKIACKPDDPTPPVTETNILENKPTRVTFEKRDAKYSYLIPDETTTFEVYRCPNGEECHPGDYSTVEQREAAGMELVKFYSRAVIPGDEEDPGVEVYKMMSYSDAQNRAKCEGNNTSNCYVTSIHPDGGKVIFRYLASGYNYVLYETVAPKNYLLPTGRDAENSFVVRNDTVSVEEVKIPNQPTGLLIRKYDDEGRLLGGAKFKVSEVVNYNPNISISEQQLTNLKFKTIKQGVYEYRPVLDSSLVITCEGSSCSDTSSFSFDQDWSNFDTLLTSSGETIKNVLTEGTAIIQYLEYGKYYVIEEVEAPKGHSLPEGEARYTLIHIGENTSVIEDTEDTFINYPTAFTFYKFDEYNNLLDGAKFKLQKLNDNKAYITLNVTKVEGEDSLYKVDNTSVEDIIETTNGKATVYYLEEGQYRVVEVQAPDGKELPKKTLNVATFFVDKDGNVFGENIITNKAPTDKTIVKPTAKANLIINIQTGQNVVKYGLIIAILVAAITGLMIFMKKRK